MRIISGKFKGYRFNPPADKWPTRPTTDMSREALYNILENRLNFEEISFLDLFGGSGSHSYECISRGCKDVTYVDNFKGCVAFTEAMADKLDIREYLTILRMDVFTFIKNNSRKFDYIFAGPPYKLQNISDIPDMILTADMLNPDGILVLEHNPHVDLSGHPRLTDTRKYGQTIFSFFTA